MTTELLHSTTTMAAAAVNATIASGNITAPTWLAETMHSLCDAEAAEVDEWARGFVSPLALVQSACVVVVVLATLAPIKVVMQAGRDLLDRDRDGKITLNDFLPQKARDVLDRDGDGKVTAADAHPSNWHRRVKVEPDDAKADDDGPDVSQPLQERAEASGGAGGAGSSHPQNSQEEKGEGVVVTVVGPP